MKEIEYINPKILTISSAIIGFALIGDLSADEQNAISNWFILIGQVLKTNSGFQILLENNIKDSDININSKEMKDIYNPFCYDKDTIINILNNLNKSYTKKDIEILKRTIEIMYKKICDLENLNSRNHY